MRMGTSPSSGIVYLISLRKTPNFLMSEEYCSTSWLGKTLVQKPDLPLPKDTCSWTSSGSCLYWWKKLKVCLKICRYCQPRPDDRLRECSLYQRAERDVPTGEPPWTPLFIQLAPNLFSSKLMDVACPPQTDPFSRIVTLNWSGCWARVAAQDMPAAPAPTITTCFWLPSFGGAMLLSSCAAC